MTTSRLKRRTYRNPAPHRQGQDGADPFFIRDDAVISFSGGRSSAMMLWKILEAHGGTLPSGVKVLFANTGLEAEETLMFVDEVAQRWGLDIVWLESYVSVLPNRTATRRHGEWDGFWEEMRENDIASGRIPNDEQEGSRFTYELKRVDFQGAARFGEPFEALMKAREMMPNLRTRFCTSELKTRAMRHYLKSQGLGDVDLHYIGIRADEMRRFNNMNGQRDEQHWPVMPLASAGITKQVVSAFWREQPFNLGLEDSQGATPRGNCDYCFMKAPGKLRALAREELARRERGEEIRNGIFQWIRWEEAFGGTALPRSSGKTYRIILDEAREPPRKDEAVEPEQTDCFYCA